MDTASFDNDDLRLIGRVLQAAINEVGVPQIPCSGSRRLFELVAGGERDFEVLKAAVLATDNVVALKASSNAVSPGR